MGSPPRVWGRRILDIQQRLQEGFTPTCVGTARKKPGPTRSHAGSPPRVWGRRAPMISAADRVGFTPTCVGTAYTSWCRLASRWVHPHVCGDGWAGGEDDEGLTGSPPRVWGRQVKYMLPMLDSGFTPTCVGTAQLRGGSKPADPGSPPRVWGRHDDQGDPERRDGFTPTCVGTASKRPG